MRAWIAIVLTVAGVLACAGAGPPTLALRPVRSIEAERAVGLPLRVFAVPTSESGLCERGPHRFAVVQLDRDALLLGDEQLEVLAAGRLATSALADGSIPSLQAGLSTLATQAGARAQEGCVPFGLGEETGFEGRLLISVDPAVPGETLQQVISTANRAGFDELYFRVHDPSPTNQLVVETDRPRRVDLSAADPVGTFLRRVDREVGGSFGVVDFGAPGPAQPVSSEGNPASSTSLTLSDAIAVLPLGIGILEVPPNSTLASPLATIEVEGPLTVDQVRSGLEPYGRALAYCMTRERRSQPDLQGSIQMELTVRPDGGATRVRRWQGELGQPPLEPCLSALLVRLQGLPTADAPTTVWLTLAYPTTD